MGEIETRNIKRAKKEKLQKLIIDSVAMAGILSIGLVAPNVIKSMNKLGLIPKLRQKEYISSSASKLAKRGLLKFQDGVYKLTKDGEKLLRRWELAEYKLRKQKKWDGKWRMVIFDIPEKKKRVRRQISSLFNQAGLYRLQDSVWVFPYDCEDIIGLLKTDFGVGKDMLYVITDEIENDRHLRNEFGLYN